MAEKKRRRIEIKARIEIFERILNCEKFDIRCEICECDIGDTLILQEWDNLTEEETGRTIEKEIKYILLTENQLWPQTQEEKHNFQTILF